MRRQLLAAALALMAGASGGAWAQETTSGSIQGTVVDAQGAAVPGATVTIASAQGVKTFVTDSAGRFFAPFITPGKVSVRVELTGFAPIEHKNVDVRLGSRLEMTFPLKVGDLQEVVEVVGTAPVVDTTSTTAGGVLDSASLQRLPVGRSLTDTLYLVPGVSDGQLGRQNPSIGGGSALENNYVIDGVNITDTGFGAIGAYNSTYGSLGSGVTSDFVKETQVKTAGFEAEYGQATGGVVNVVTKSGGNEFSGSVFGYFRPDALESSYDEVTAPNGAVNTVGRNEYDFGVSLGGALVQDKLFFFGTFNPQFQTRTFAAPEGFPYASLGRVDRKRKIYSYAGKLSFQANSSHRFDVSVFGDPSKGEMGLQRFATLRRLYYAGNPGTSAIEGGYSEIEYGGNSQTLRYDGIINPNWLVEASVAHARNKFLELPATDDWLYTDLTRVPNGTSGGLGFYENNNGDNLQFSLKSTHIFNAGGNHQFRYGVAYEDIEFTRAFNYTGPGVTVSNGVHTVTGVPVQIRRGAGVIYYRATRGRFVPTSATTQDYYNAFAQDAWQMGRLTLRPGIRWERQKLSGVQPPPEICFEDDSRPGAGDGSGSAIACNFTWTDLWAPRIGATYDIFGNGKSKAYAAWGRFYAKIPNDLAARAMSSDAGITRQNFRDAALTQPLSNGTSYAGTSTHMLLSGGAAIIDPEAGSTYKEEFVGGVEFEVARNVSLGVRYIHRAMPQILEDIGQLPLVGYFICENEPTVDYFITNVNARTATVGCPEVGLSGGAFEDPVHKYDSFEVTLNKTFSGAWGLIASYRYAKLSGNFEGFYRSDNGQSDPAISSLFDFPTDDPSYAAIAVPEFGMRGDIRFLGTTLGEGRLPNDRPHQVKVYGNYTWGSLNLGLGFNWGSGQVLTPLAANWAYNNSGEIPEAVRGQGIQTVEGAKERAASDTAVDLHADFTFKLNDRQRLVFVADVFNLFNRQEALNYENYTENAAGSPNPNYGYPLNGGGSNTSGLQAPMSVRLGARFEF